MRRLNRLAATTALVALCWAPTSQAGVPTVDASAIAEAAKTAANTAQQVNKLTSVVASTQKMVSSLGSSGPGAFFLGSGSWGALTGANGSADASILAQLPHNLCAVRGCPETEANAEKYARGEIKSVAEGLAFANRTFYTTSAVKGAQRRDFLQARANASREAAISGYAVALAMRTALANTEKDTQDLESVINEAGTLREDVQANSAAIIALHRQIAQMQGLMASMLEVQSASVIASDRDLLKPGGAPPEQAPDVYNAADYAGPGGVRTQITNQRVMMGPSVSNGSSGGILAEALGGFSSNPLVKSAADSAGLSGGDAVSSLLGVASTVARETGNYDVARGLSSMGSAAKTGNPQDMLWAGAETVASTSGNYQVRGVMRAARRATRTNNPADVTEMLDLSRAAAQAAGHSEAASWLSDLQYSVRGGEVDPKTAVERAAKAVAQVNGDRELEGFIDSGSRIASSVDRNMTGQQRKQLYDLANETVKTSGKRANSADLEEVSRAADSAKNEVPWDNPDTAQDESAQ